ncbi:MAG: hypothetical protein LBM98_08655 [Oscillospiraceae bacterium]|jgi:type II secretory pathway predicted ATPase ExeA|nr:hypothetical protein [Oscillospiraceae bacterium]
MLEEIRFLMNVKMDYESPMALILSGQSELWDKKLKLQSYAAIRQRIDLIVVVAVATAFEMTLRAEIFVRCH